MLRDLKEAGDYWVGSGFKLVLSHLTGKGKLMSSQRCQGEGFVLLVVLGVDTPHPHTIAFVTVPSMWQTPSFLFFLCLLLLMSSGPGLVLEPHLQMETLGQ